MNNANKSMGLLKSIMKKNYINKHQTMDVNHSNRYSPSKKQKRQIISINKASKADFNLNLEKKKIIYQQSIQKLDKNNKLHLSQNKKNMDINHLYKSNSILNGNNIPNNFKTRLNNTKTINNFKNKNYNTSLQKKIGSKSYVDLFQNNNIYNSNDHIIPRGGRTISNSIYEKIYDFEIDNMNINNNNNYDNNNTNEYNNLVEEANNIINVLINYINIIKNEYEKILVQKVKEKDKYIIKLKQENEFLIKENKKLKYQILEIFYCVKKFENNEDKNKFNEKYFFSIKQLLDENLFLRNCLKKTDYIDKNYLIKLENDIKNQFRYKELLNIKKIEEEKNNQNLKDKEKKDNIDNNNYDEINPFKFINENNSNNSNSNSNNSTNKINHKRQKTQFKLNSIENNDKIDKSDSKIPEKENNENTSTSDALSSYINSMNDNILLSRTKNGSQKNLLMVKNRTKNINKENNDTKNKDNNCANNESNNSSLSEQSYESIIHNKDNKNKNDNTLLNNDKDKKLSGNNDNFSFDKYSQRIEFTK